LNQPHRGRRRPGKPAGGFGLALNFFGTFFFQEKKVQNYDANATDVPLKQITGNSISCPTELSLPPVFIVHDPCHFRKKLWQQFAAAKTIQLYLLRIFLRRHHLPSPASNRFFYDRQTGSHQSKI
jgi:hypothetical protein